MGEDKLWVDLGGQPLIAYALQAVAAADCFDVVVVAAPEARWAAIRDLAADAGIERVELVAGGDQRQDSVAAALELCVDAEWVCVHDAARPMVSPELLRGVLEAAREYGAATAGVPCVDTVKQVEDDHVVATLERRTLIATQTPQAFAMELLLRAHREAKKNLLAGDDDAFLVEQLGATVVVVPGEVRNLKVTHPYDMTVLRALLGAS
jgi:2-C-methyl-D-erythritol 4-phosphate cytidylyltransferase